tara:strand:- start:462 stop:863 length:402 start_codon:yes stop_codon:yes gene_type:complete
MGKFRFVKSVMRSLKRQYGQQVTLYKTTTHGTVDWTDGSVSGRVTTTKTIKKAVVMPGVGTRQTGFFGPGGQFDKTQRDIIIDTNDIGTFGLDMDTTIRFGGSDYKITEFHDYEEGNAYYITCMKLEGQTDES